MKNQFLYKKIRRGWIVVNKSNGAHSHFKSEYGCNLIIKFLKERIYPENSYLQVSYDRLKTPKEKKTAIIIEILMEKFFANNEMPTLEILLEKYNSLTLDFNKN